MGQVSREQSLELMAKLGTNTDWFQLVSEVIQRIIKDPTSSGREFTRFLANGGQVQVSDFFRETGEFTIDIPVLARPMLAELQAKFSWIRSIECDTSPTEAVALKLGTVLRLDEERINSFEYEQRRAPLAGRLFGCQQLIWLVEHQDEHPAFKALLGRIYIDGPGLIVVHADGYRHFPCLDVHGARWYLDWSSTEDVLFRHGRIAVSGK